MAEASNPYSSMDLFSGCGGLSLGLEAAGIETKIAIDSWSDALHTLSQNLPTASVELFDLSRTDAGQFGSKFKDIDFVVGGPPCQGFSISGKRDPADPRNRLYEGFHQIVQESRPKMFLMENVPNLASMEKGKLLTAIVHDFEALGYRVSFDILLASNFGVPQNRRRLIIVGSLIGDVFDFRRYLNPLDRPAVTSGEALSDLPGDSLEDGSAYPNPPTSQYQTSLRVNSNGVFNHQVTTHTDQTRSIINLVPDGGNYKDLPVDLQGTRRVNIAWTRINSQKPSMTIDTGHRHHFHYAFNRVPTVRESARLQSFPDNFHFFGSKTSQYRQVGNAVPPLLGAQIGKALVSYLDDH